MTKIERLERAVRRRARDYKGIKDDYSRGFKSACRQVCEYLNDCTDPSQLSNIDSARQSILDAILALNNERDECRESNWIKYGKLCIVIEMLQTIQRKFYVFDLDDEDD